MGALSGDFESMEVTENQQLLIDILKSFGKMSGIVSESNTKFKVERVNGLENYSYQMQKALDEGKDVTDKNFLADIEESRYSVIEDKIGNRTEFLRVLMAGLANNPEFRKIQTEVVKEQMGLAFKRKSNREIAESTQAKDWGL